MLVPMPSYSRMIPLNRVPYWPKLRKIVLARDSYRCYICGLSTPPADSCDHIIPRSAGGSNDLSNLAAAHLLCNKKKGKGSIPVVPRNSRVW